MGNAGSDPSDGSPRSLSRKASANFSETPAALRYSTSGRRSISVSPSSSVPFEESFRDHGRGMREPSISFSGALPLVRSGSRLLTAPPSISLFGKEEKASSSQTPAELRAEIIANQKAQIDQAARLMTVASLHSDSTEDIRRLMLENRAVVLSNAAQQVTYGLSAMKLLLECFSIWNLWLYKQEWVAEFVVYLKRLEFFLIRADQVLKASPSTQQRLVQLLSQGKSDLLRITNRRLLTPLLSTHDRKKLQQRRDHLTRVLEEGTAGRSVELNATHELSLQYLGELKQSFVELQSDSLQQLVDRMWAGRSAERTRYDLAVRNDNILLFQFQPLDFAPDVERMLARYYPGTRRWILQQLDEWMSTKPSENIKIEETKQDLSSASSREIILQHPYESRVFWLRADHGVGKSTIAALLLDSFREQAVGIHMCRFDYSERNDPFKFVLTTSIQLAQTLPAYRQALLLRLKDMPLPPSPRALGALSVRELWKTILSDPLATIDPENIEIYNIPGCPPPITTLGPALYVAAPSASPNAVTATASAAVSESASPPPLPPLPNLMDVMPPAPPPLPPAPISALPSAPPPPPPAAPMSALPPAPPPPAPMNILSPAPPPPAPLNVLAPAPPPPAPLNVLAPAPPPPAPLSAFAPAPPPPAPLSVVAIAPPPPAPLNSFASVPSPPPSLSVLAPAPPPPAPLSVLSSPPPPPAPMVLPSAPPPPTPLVAVSTPFTDSSAPEDSFKRFLLVIDGLDEAAGQVTPEQINTPSPLLHLLRDEMWSLPAWLGVVILSRPDAHVAAALRDHHPVELDIALDNPQHLEDLSEFLSGVLPPCLSESVEIVEDEVEAMASKCQGSFLLSRLVLDPFLDPRNQHVDQAFAVEQMPSPLRSFIEDYLRIVTSKMGKKQAAILKSILQVIFAAQEPLLLPSIAQVLQIEPALVTNLLQQIKGLLLLEGEETALRVTVFHKAIQDYLTNPPAGGPEPCMVCDVKVGHEALSEACQKALLAPSSFSTSRLSVSSRRQDSKVQLNTAPVLRMEEAFGNATPFLRYAIRFGPLHALVVRDNMALMNLLCNLQYVELRSIFGTGYSLLREYIDFVFPAIRDVSTAVALREYYRFCRSEVPRTLRSSSSLYQLALAYPADGAVYRQAFQLEKWWQKRVPHRLWIEWLNKPRQTSFTHPISVLPTAASPLRSVHSTTDSMFIFAVTDSSIIKRHSHTEEIVNELPVGGKCVVVSPCGRYIAVGQDSEISVYSAVTGTFLTKMHGRNPKSERISFSPEETTLLVGVGENNVVLVWSVLTGKPVLQIVGHEQAVHCARFSGDGNFIASCSSDCTIRISSASSGKVKLVIYSASWTPIRDAHFSLDGQLVLGLDEKKVVTIWNAQTGELKTTLVGFWNSALWSPDNRRVLVVSSEPAVVALFDSTTGQQLTELSTIGDEINDWRYLADGRVVGASNSGKLMFWDLPLVLPPPPASPVLAAQHDFIHTSPITTVIFAPNGQNVLSTGHDNVICIRDRDTGLLRARFETKTNTNEERGFPCACISPDCRRALTGKNGLRLWDISASRCEREFDVKESILSVAFAPNGQLILAGLESGHIRVWNSEGQFVREIATNFPVSLLAVSASSQLLSAKQLSDTTGIWEVTSGLLVASCQGHTGAVHGFAFHPTSNFLASASADKTIRLFDRSAGNCKYTLAIDCVAHAVQWNNDGSVLIVGAADGVHFFSFSGDRGLKQQSVLLHPKPVISLSLSSDGKYLAVAEEAKNGASLYYSMTLWEHQNYFVGPMIGLNLALDQHKDSFVQFAVPPMSYCGCFLLSIHNDAGSSDSIVSRS